VIFMRNSILSFAAATLLSVVGGAQASRAQSVAGPSHPFWQEIGDSVLSRLIVEAQRASNDVRVAEARLDATRASRRLSAFDLAPTITANGSALRTRQSFAQIPGLSTPLPQQDLYDVGFDAAWELDLFGRTRHTVNANGALVESAEHSVDDVQLSLAAEVARTYFELRGAQRQLAVAMRNADVQRKTVQLTQDRLAGGRGTAFDVERARSVLQLTLAAVPTLQSQIATGRNRIGVLLGRSAEAAPAELMTDGPLPHLPDTVAIGSPREVVRNRPDVLAAERQLAAQSLSLSASRAEYLPRFSLAASAGYTANRIESLTRTGTSRLLIGPVVSFPLLDLGRVKQRVDLAQSRENEAQAQYAATVLHAGEEAESAIVTYTRAHERVGILTEAVTSSAHAAELAQERFEAGLTDFLQVLDAQRTLLDAENQLATAHTTAATALVAVYKAAGGGWASR
jgi:NodT family efflux transporter outer membrane factor (OMF) lipoprotein